MTHRTLQRLLIFVLAAMILTAFAVDGTDVFRAFWEIQRHPARPLADFIEVAGIGGALVNARGLLVGALALAVGLPPVPAVLVGAAGGLLTGFLLPSIAVAMLHMHQGYNLYNMGLTCGFFGLFAAAFIRGFGGDLPGLAVWETDPHPVLVLMVPVLSVFLLIAGISSGGRSAFTGLKKLLKMPGRLPSDFVDGASPEGMLVNAGLIGLIGSGYVWAVGADFSGPVIGGLLTIIGFGAFGTHLKNSWPVVAGVILAVLATGNSLAAPGPILAAIFCTTLAPLAGEFGILAGIIAGVIHFIMVSQSGSWHGGMDLYNNGFAGGLTATIIVSVIQWYRTNKSER